MNLHGLHPRGEHVGGEGEDHAGLDDASLHTTHRDCSNTFILVHILQRKPQRFVCWSGGGNDGVQGLKQGGPAGLALIPLNIPDLVPGHVGAGLQHVVAMPPGDGHEWNRVVQGCSQPS